MEFVRKGASVGRLEEAKRGLNWSFILTAESGTMWPLDCQQEESQSRP